EMEEYSVEKIEKKRVVNGIAEYFLKWKGYPRSQNTWEPVEHLAHCTDLIVDFELRSQKRKATSTDVNNCVDESAGMQFGFARGLKPAKILGATNSSGSLMFLMSWTNSKRAEMVPAKLANIKCPQLVIKFYEERLTWMDRKKK
ncbi:hypothetical protein KR222_000825, partial [Zaprionus bogoriensis]